MADNGTLHELKVAIRVALSGYKKDMGNVKAETKKAREAINSETSKIKSAMGNVSTQKAQQEIEKLTGQLEKQKEKITQQEIVVNRLKSQYDDLVSGVSQDRSVSGIEKQLKSAEKEFDTVRTKLFELYDAYDLAETASKNGGSSSQLSDLSVKIDELEPKYESLGRKVMSLTERLQQVKMNPEASASAQDLAAKLDAETKKLERMKNEAGTVKEKLDAVLHSKSPPTTSNQLNQIIRKIRELTKSAKTSSVQTSNGFKRMETAIGKVKSRITNLVGSVLVFEVMRRAIVAVKEQLTSCLKTNQEFASSLNIIKTNLQVSFAAIYTAVLPAINALMSALASITTAIASLLSSLFGKTYAESLKTAQGLKTATKALNGYGSAAKDKQLFSFDETHNINKEETSGGGEDGLVDTSMMLGETEGLLDKIKKALATLFDPFKEAWEDKGAGVIEAAKYAFSSIVTLLKDIGASFAEVWSNGTGYQVCSTILDIVRNILLTIGNIATGWDEAWNFEDTGTKIVQNLFDILLNILDAFERMSEATAEWSANLDFTPILTAFNGLLDAIEPLTSTICDALVWMYENVLLPFAGWTIEDAMPTFFNLLASVLSLLNSVLSVFQPLALWLWESFLQPIAEWTGGTICEVLGFIAELLTAISDWITEHQETISSVILMIGEGAAYIGGAITAMTQPAIAGIMALIASGTSLSQSWENIKAKAISVWNTIKLNVTQKIADIKNGISLMLTTVKLIWVTTWTNCKITVTTIFNGIWSAIKGVINSILGGIEAMANGVINGVNAVINALNGLHFEIPDWVPGFGGKTFGFSIPLLSTVSLPRLAKGGIVDGATPLIAGEAGKEAIVPLENNTGWIELISNRISDFINGRLADQERDEEYSEINITIPITLELDGDTLLKKLIKARKRRGYPIVVEGV